MRKENFCIHSLDISDSYFYHQSPIEQDVIFKESLFDCTYLKKYEAGCIGRSSEKKNIDVSKTITTTELEPSVALVSSFQLLTSFTKNPNIWES